MKGCLAAFAVVFTVFSVLAWAAAVTIEAFMDIFGSERFGIKWKKRKK